LLKKLCQDLDKSNRSYGIGRTQIALDAALIHKPYAIGGAARFLQADLSAKRSRLHGAENECRTLFRRNAARMRCKKKIVALHERVSGANLVAIGA